MENPLGSRPHVTIMRNAQKRLTEESIPAIDWRVEECALLSGIRYSGADYNVLQRFPLRGGPLPALPEQGQLF
jgi:2'-5' RNA ligase